MKVKFFEYGSYHQKNQEEWEENINKFIKDKRVIFIKQTDGIISVWYEEKNNIKEINKYKKG